MLTLGDYLFLIFLIVLTLRLMLIAFSGTDPSMKI